MLRSREQSARELATSLGTQMKRIEGYVAGIDLCLACLKFVKGALVSYKTPVQGRVSACMLMKCSHVNEAFCFERRLYFHR